jgi:uncharacterized protein (TIGR02452 family)
MSAPARTRRATIAKENNEMVGLGKRLPTREARVVELPRDWLETVGSLTLSTQVHVIEAEPLSISQHLTRRELENAVLSFGAPRRPGGSYESGRTAQEEDLCCRMPQLYPSLRGHPTIYGRAEGLGDTTALLTRNLSVARDVDHALVSDEGPLVNVITAAMPDLKGSDGPRIVDVQTWEAKVRKRVRTVLWAAYQSGIENLVLGAWGAGAFRNPGGWVARVFATELASMEWRGAFRKIVFAISDPKATAESKGTTGHSAMSCGGLPASQRET